MLLKNEACRQEPAEGKASKNGPSTSHLIKADVGAVAGLKALVVSLRATIVNDTEEITSAAPRTTILESMEEVACTVLQATKQTP